MRNHPLNFPRHFGALTTGSLAFDGAFKAAGAVNDSSTTSGTYGLGVAMSRIDWAAHCRHSRDVRNLFTLAGDSDTDEIDPSGFVIKWLEDAETRVPMLTLHDAANPWDSDETALWVLVVPLWTDVENAVPGDLVFDDQETSTGTTWRAAFRHQTTLPASRLGATLGWLTASGAHLLHQALDASIPPERTGSPLESAYDPRLDADSWIAEAIQRSLQASVPIDEDDDFWDEAFRQVPTEAVTGDPLGARPGVVLIPKFGLSRSNYALAAASSPLSDADCVLVPKTGGYDFRAKLWLQLDTDELRLEATSVGPEFDGADLTFISHFKHRDPLISQAIVRVGVVVVLARHEAVDETDIVSVEIRSS
jgi:hypothetical protein